MCRTRRRRAPRKSSSSAGLTRPTLASASSPERSAEPGTRARPSVAWRQERERRRLTELAQACPVGVDLLADQAHLVSRRGVGLGDLTLDHELETGGLDDLLDRDAGMHTDQP